MVWESSALAASGTTHHSFAWRRRLDGSVDGMPREGLLGCCRIEVSKSLPNPALSLPWDSATDQLPALPACLAANSLPSSLSCPMPPMELLIGAGCGCPAHSAAAIRDPVSREPIRLQYPAVGLAKVGRRSIGAAGGGLPPVHAAGPCLSVTCTPALPTPSQCQSVVASVIRPPRFQVQPRPLPSCPLREINKMPANCQLPMDPDPRPLSRGLTWARRLADSGFLPPSRCPPARSTVPIPGTAPSSCFFDEVALRLHPSSIPIVTCTSMHH